MKQLNSEYKTDIKYTTDVAKLIGILLGLWPNNHHYLSVKSIIKKLINISSSVLMFCVIISNILCATFKTKTIQEKVEVAGPTSYYMVCLSKYFLFLYRQRSFRKCLDYLEEDWMSIDSPERRTIMLKNAKFARTISIYCGIFMWTGGCGHHFLKPLMSDSILTVMNISVKPFPSAVYWDIFNTGYSPLHEFVFTAIVIADLYFISMSMFSFSLSAIFIIHACGQFEIVNFNLHDLVDGLNKRKNTVQERFIDVVQSHTRVLSYVSELATFFSEIILVEIMGCATNLSILGYFAISSWKKGNIPDFVTYITLINGFIFNMFIYSYIGEMLTIQAGKVGETGYMIDWHTLPRNISLDLSFFVKVCQNPIRITAGKIVFLSMTTFTTMMKSSAAYFNIIWKT